MTATCRVPFARLDVFPCWPALKIELSLAVEYMEMHYRMKLLLPSWASFLLMAFRMLPFSSTTGNISSGLSFMALELHDSRKHSREFVFYVFRSFLKNSVDGAAASAHLRKDSPHVIEFLFDVAQFRVSGKTGGSKSLVSSSRQVSIGCLTISRQHFAGFLGFIWR